MRLKRNELKLHLLSTMEPAIKKQGVKAIFGKEIDVLRETNRAFEGIMKYKREQHEAEEHKMRGLYSYNWLDHPDYRHAKKIERKIVKYKSK